MISRNTFVEKIANAINNNEIALFVAAGLSASTGQKNWAQMLTPCADVLELEINENTDLYMIAQYYENEYGKSDLIHIFEKNINKINDNSSYLNSVLDLGFREIWTTNYDTVIEDNLKKRNIVSKVIHNDMDLNNFTEGGVHIFKMNGDITNPHNMVVSKSDLENYAVSHQLMLTFFRRELVSKSFLFLGYSFTDSLVLNSLSTIKNCLQGACNTHYTILKNEHSQYFDYFVQDLWKRYNIKALIVESYDEIPQIIESINEKIKERKVFISGSFDILPYDQDEFADALCNELVQNLYDNDYIILTGMGRKIGNYLAGHAFEYLMKKHFFSIEKKLIMRPFFEKMNLDDKTRHRNKMIEDCQHAIFIFGKSPSTPETVINSQGVMEEYKIAKQLRKNIISIPATGYTAKQIFKEQKNSIVEYPYLENYIDQLEHENNPQKISRLIVNILQDCVKS